MARETVKQLVAAHAGLESQWKHRKLLRNGRVGSGVLLGAGTLDLSDLQGRPTVLNFWAGLCPPCRAELPDLQLFYEDFNDQVNVVGVDIGTFTGLGNQDDAQNLLRELEIAYPNGFTSDDTVVRRYQVLSMPTTFFINSKGEIFKKWNGALNRDILTEQTTELLSRESGP